MMPVGGEAMVKRNCQDRRLLTQRDHKLVTTKQG